LLNSFNVGLSKYGCVLWIAVHPSYGRKGIDLSLTNAGTEYLKRDGAQAVFCFNPEKKYRCLGDIGQSKF
jgi:ribosomal protein S18 acetylase RimI-like enzyme